MGNPTSSCGARSRACGRICRRMRSEPGAEMQNSEFKMRKTSLQNATRDICILHFASCIDRRPLAAGASASASRCRSPAGADQAARHGQAVLRRLSQRPRQDGRRQLRRAHAGERRPARRRVREGRAQDARPRHAAAGRPAAGCRRRRLAGRVARDVARPRGRPGARPRPRRPAPAESQGIHQRRARSARRRLRCHRGAAGRRRGRRVRQHRRRAAGVAVLHRAVRHRRARGGGQGDGPARRATGRMDVPRRARHAAHARARPAARYPRRHPRQRRSPGRRRVHRRHRRHGHPHLGQRHGVREPAGRDARQQGSSTRR